MSEHEDLDAREKALLERWTPTEPSAGFADRVLERIQAPAVVHSRRRVGLGVAVAAGVLFAGLLLSRVSRDPGLITARQDLSAAGSLTAPDRTTLSIGTRGTAVAESGAVLRYAVEPDGATRVFQSAGNVFYRVERSGPFVVETGLGEARVTGTSFRVEVLDMNGKTAGAASGARSDPQGRVGGSAGFARPGLWGGAAAGALVASTVLVTVYEGSVVTASPAGELRLAAGEAAAIEAKATPRRVEPVLSTGTRAAALAPEADAAAPDTVEGLRAERLMLIQKLAKLEGELKSAPTSERDERERERGHTSYNLDQAELLKLVERCELRWDNIGLSDPQTMKVEDAQKLSLSEDERATIERIFAEQQRSMVAAIDSAYVELTGDDSGALSTSAKLNELDDKVAKLELKQIFQRLARERAGLQAAPADLMSTSPTERVYRMITSSGDVLEQRISAELGGDAGRRVRDLRHGWGSQHGSSYGCP